MISKMFLCYVKCAVLSAKMFLIFSKIPLDTLEWCCINKGMNNGVTDMTDIKEINSDRLIFSLSRRPYEVYVEALRRDTRLMENKSAWTAKRIARTEREITILKKVIRAYYDLRRAA